MNREEFYKLRREARLLRSCVRVPNSLYPKMDFDLSGKVWGELYKAAYGHGKYKHVLCSPKFIFWFGKACFLDKKNDSWGARYDMKRNITELPNSYPHKTKNP